MYGEELTTEQLREHMSSHRHFYNYMMRQGFWLPAWKSYANTMRFLLAVFKLQAWLPKEELVGKRRLPFQIAAKELHAIVDAALSRHHGNIGPAWQATREHLRKRMADAEFYIGLLSVVEPTHAIFGRSYVHVKYQAPKPVMVANVNGCFDGLPKLPPSEQKKRNMLGGHLGARPSKTERLLAQ